MKLEEAISGMKEKNTTFHNDEFRLSLLIENNALKVHGMTDDFTFKYFSKLPLEGWVEDKTNLEDELSFNEAVKMWEQGHSIVCTLGKSSQIVPPEDYLTNYFTIDEILNGVWTRAKD